MERRKFVIGLGSLAAGGAAATGTGAVSQLTAPDRAVNVQVTGDSSADIALIPGNDPDIALDNDGELELNLSENGYGVNIDSIYEYGNPDDPSGTPAFTVQNNTSQSFKIVEFSFTPDDNNWVTANDDQSFIRFTFNDSGLFDNQGNDPNVKKSMTFPPQKSDGTSFGTGLGSVEISASSGEQFDPADTIEVGIEVNTTGTDASTDDVLSGDLRINLLDSDV